MFRCVFVRGLFRATRLQEAVILFIIKDIVKYLPHLGLERRFLLGSLERLFFFN
jgi:hypothetical protein